MTLNKITNLSLCLSHCILSHTMPTKHLPSFTTPLSKQASKLQHHQSISSKIFPRFPFKKKAISFNYFLLHLYKSMRTADCLVPNIPPNPIIPTMRLRKRLIPRLRRAHASMCEISSLCSLPVWSNRAAFVEGDLAVVACAAGSGPVLYRCACETGFYGCGVDAGFEGWSSSVLV